MLRFKIQVKISDVVVNAEKMSTQELLNHPNFLPALKRQAPYDLEDSNDFVTVEADTEPVFGSFHQAADEKNSVSFRR